MSTREPSSYTAADLSDPSIDAATLALLAQYRPDLRPLVQTHPNCYPELATWIATQEPTAPQVAATETPDASAADASAPDAAGGSAPDAAAQPQGTASGPAESEPVATEPAAQQPTGQQPAGQPSRPQLPTAEEWARQFQATNGREPSMSEYQAAVAGGQIAGQRDASIQQISDGAKQIAAGAKDFFNSRIAPAAAEAARTVQASAAEARTSPTGWRAWLPWAVPALGLLGFLAAFLPYATVRMMGLSESVSFIQSNDGFGVMLILSMLIVIGLGAAGLFVRKPWAPLAAAISAAALGFIWMLLTIFLMIGVSSESRGFASPGFGAILLLIVSIALLAVGILLLISRRKTSAAAAPSPYASPSAYPAAPQQATQYPAAQQPQYPSAPQQPQYPSAPQQRYPGAPQQPQHPSTPGQQNPPVPPAN